MSKKPVQKEDPSEKESWEEVDLLELREFGYIQEANRQFFHLIGLALGVKVHLGDDGKPDPEKDPELVIFDFRNDPEGVMFGIPLDADKGQRVYDEFARRSMQRRKLFKEGRTTQPLDRVVKPAEIKRLRRDLKGGKNTIISRG